MAGNGVHERMTGISELSADLPHWLEHAWLERYLDGELEAHEEEAFEAYLLDKPHLIAKLDADNLLRAAIAEDAGALKDVRVSDVSSGVRETRRSHQGPTVWLALAAGLVFGVGLSWLGSPYLGDIHAGTHAPSRIVFDTLRGELSAPREEAGDPAAPVRVYELPLPPGANVVSAQAVHDGRATPLPPASPSTDGYLTYLVPASWRGRGEFRIEIDFADGRTAGTRLTFPL